MAVLTGFKKVAVVKLLGKDYHYAIYDDGCNYEKGDQILVSGACKEIVTIGEVITAEEAAERYKKNIIAEVICKVDTSAYDVRVENRKKAVEIKKCMDKMIKEMDETLKYKRYAEDCPELGTMLEEYQKLIG